MSMKPVDEVVPGQFYQDELATDTRQVPNILKMRSPYDNTDCTIPSYKYISQDYYDREIERVWKRTWQWACRLEQIPEVGDTYIYNIVNQSILIVRTAPDEVKAYHNLCLHRGRRLRDFNGRTDELRCPYHGFCWKLDGSLKNIPAQWDFPHVDSKDFGLKEVRIDSWAGFVFINMDLDCAPLADTLGVVPEHFERWDLENRVIVADVTKVMRCNWKLAQEAFLDSFHVVATHPQLLGGLNGTTSQYDVFGNVSRTLSPVMGEKVPIVSRALTEQERYDAYTMYLNEGPQPMVPEGVRARSFGADQSRSFLRPIVGDEVETYSDAEMLDSIWYSVFPNLSLWGGYGPKWQYSWQPYENRVDMSTMRIVVIAPFAGERPAPAKARLLGPDEPWIEAPELGNIGRVEDQDVNNLEALQRGLESGMLPEVTLSQYQESRVRHFHAMLDAYMEGDGSGR